MEENQVDGDAIADVVLKCFEGWEKKRKPLTRSDGVREWVPFSGIVVQDGRELKCLAAATGMKCLPSKHISFAKGVTIHDWHAEVLAIRSFNRFLLDECLSLLNSEEKVSEFVRLRANEERTEMCFQPFALRDGLKIFMYCSEAPCGDASMELTMAAQEDPTPWSLPNSTLSTSNPEVENQPTLHGRGYFSALGAVRRKPSRPDAPPTLSKSCTDKLSLKESTSLLSSLTSLLVSPENAYITALVLPESQLSKTAVERAFSSTGRMKALNGKKWDGGYAFKPFNIIGTKREFEYSRRQKGEVIPSNISSSWSPRGGETIIGGTLQGRKQFDIRGASKLCKRSLWRLASDVAIKAGVLGFGGLRVGSYRDVKWCSLLQSRANVKKEARSVLRGWVRNDGGDDFLIGDNNEK